MTNHICQHRNQRQPWRSNSWCRVRFPLPTESEHVNAGKNVFYFCTRNYNYPGASLTACDDLPSSSPDMVQRRKGATRLSLKKVKMPKDKWRSYGLKTKYGNQVLGLVLVIDFITMGIIIYTCLLKICDIQKLSNTSM